MNVLEIRERLKQYVSAFKIWMRKKKPAFGVVGEEGEDPEELGIQHQPGAHIFGGRSYTLSRIELPGDIPLSFRFPDHDLAYAG